jgi:hypothetical protein
VWWRGCAHHVCVAWSLAPCVACRARVVVWGAPLGCGVVGGSDRLGSVGALIQRPSVDDADDAACRCMRAPPLHCTRVHLTAVSIDDRARAVSLLASSRVNSRRRFDLIMQMHDTGPRPSTTKRGDHRRCPGVTSRRHRGAVECTTFERHERRSVPEPEETGGGTGGTETGAR